jgi:hypothetical protein
MKKMRYWTRGCAALLVVAALTACSGSNEATEAEFAGVHVFEGRVSEATGGSFVLVVGDTSYALEGNIDEIKKYSGQDVQVTASMGENTLRVTRIAPVQRPAEADSSGD